MNAENDPDRRNKPHPKCDELVKDITRDLELRETIEGDLVVIGKINKKLRKKIFIIYGVNI